jgi:uncharacterized membrane protein YgcG
MRKFSISAALVVVLAGGAVAGAGVVGAYALLTPLASADPSLAVPTSAVHLFQDDNFPVRLRKQEGGLLVPASSATVSFVRGGELVQDAEVSEPGTVQVTGLSTGPYSVFVHGPDGFAAFGTWLSPPSDSTDLQVSIVDVGLIPCVDMPTVRKLVTEHLTAAAAVAPAPAAETPAAEGEVAVTSTFATRELTQGYGFEQHADGKIRGRVVSSGDAGRTPLANVKVFFVKGGELVRAATTDVDGLFEADQLDAGVYSFVAVGQGVFVAVGVDVHPAIAEDVADVTEVAIDGGAIVEVPIGQCCPVYPGDCVLVEEYWQTDAYCGGETAHGAPCCGQDLYGEQAYGGGGYAGGGGGGYAGGGGGAYGGGGFGALLGLGALGLAAAALSDDDEDRGTRVVSPRIP